MRALGREHGFSIVEAMIASLLLIIGGLAVLTAVDTAARTSFRAEQSQVQINALQDEIERIRQLPYGQVALTSLPTHSADQSNPAWRASGTTFALDRGGTDARPLVYEGASLEAGGAVAGAAVSPGPSPFDAGDVSGEMYRYVVWVNDNTCPASLCPGTQDMKRVIVASLLDDTASGGERIYQEVHADIVDPDAERVDNALPPENEAGSAWQFWLTDTPCNQDQRQPIVAQHPSHNTLSTCDRGLGTGTTAGAPDLMFTEAPPLDPAHPPDDQPLFDYATDVEPAVDPLGDRGLQMRVPSGLEGQTGCLPLNLAELTESNMHLKTHRWLSPAIPSGYSILLDGRGTLSLWTQTISGAVHPGKICAYLFTRQLNALGVPVDTPVANLDDPLAGDHFPYSQASWPSGNWSQIKVPMHFAAANGGAVRLLPGTRLGLAIAVHRNATLPGEGLQFNYDTPSFDSRLELETTSLLPSFG
ncbi:MAG: type IV pilus modification PilV family protein [Solirubrobacterales bacterium]